MFDQSVPPALPPDVAMMQLLFGKQITYSLAAMARLGVADHMGATPISIETLAKKVDAHAPSLYRVMRMLASVGVFTEASRQFALTPIGELLRTDQKNSARSEQSCGGRSGLHGHMNISPIVCAPAGTV
jgi:hypothetical protein